MIPHKVYMIIVSCKTHAQLMNCISFMKFKHLFHKNDIFYPNEIRDLMSVVALKIHQEHLLAYKMDILSKNPSLYRQVLEW